MYAPDHGQTFVAYKLRSSRRGQDVVRSGFVGDEDTGELAKQTLIDEIDHQLRLWERRTVRRGVRRLTEIVRDRLVSGEIYVESRTQVAAAVSRIGNEPGWLPCDVLTVSRAIRSRDWNEELAHPLCTTCRQREDVSRADSWKVGPSKATAS